MSREPTAKTHERKMQEIQHRHEMNLAFLDWFKADPEIKWILILAISTGVDAAIDLMNGLKSIGDTPEPPSETSPPVDYWGLFGAVLGGFAIGGAAGSVIAGYAEKWKGSYQDKTFDNPYDLTAAIIENAAEGTTMLAISMLTMGKAFGTSGIGGILKAVV